ncbi:MAG: YHS domain-containing protein [Phycisphaerae bacterium]|jgi:YHS domain-containing protein
MSRGLKITTFLLVIFLITLVTVVGCKKKTETADNQDIPQAQAKAIEQTTCPVMTGNPINPEIYTEYQGKKVYFCCPACKPIFEKDPEKYLDKLPQFKDQADSMMKQAEQTTEPAPDQMKDAANKMPEVVE